MTVWNQLRHEIDSFPCEIRNLPVLQPVAPAQIRADLALRYAFDKPIDLGELTAEMRVLFRRWTVHVTHPRYFGLFNPSVREAGVVADALAALYNPQLAAWSHSPAANEIERLTLRTFTRELGFDPEHSLANFTSGGAEANFSAVTTALIHRYPQIAEAGVAALAARPALYLSGESHHSFVKIARLTGLGTNALRHIPTDNAHLLDVDALVRQVETDRNEGWAPLMVVATAGTTGAGLVDPLPQVAAAARDQDLWYHVDAAWGGSAVLSPRLKPILSGIEEADSVTWDAHKWLSVPMGAGMFFCRHPEAVKRAFAISTTYMPPKADEFTLDPYAVTAQWSRRAIGLKVFMTLAELGLEGFAKLLEHQTDMGNDLRRRLLEAGWLIRNDTRLPVVCFTHRDIQRQKLTTAAVLERIYARGKVWISEVVLGGTERVLRACITSYRTKAADVACLIDELEWARKL